MKKKIIISNQEILPTPIGNIWESFESVVYGPIVSRRFRYSLGINLFAQKVCSLNCTYCDIGRTSAQTVKEELSDRKSIFSLEEIGINVERAFNFHQFKKTEIDKITICGIGEATLHPQFSAVVDIIVKMRNKYFPNIPTAILSAPTEINNPKIVNALKKLDVRVLKLDAGDSETYNRICRPLQNIAELDFHKQVDNLIKLSGELNGKIFISSAIVKSLEKKYDNINSIVNFMPKILNRIRPAEYHIHNIDYPIFDNDSTILRLELNEMLGIAEKIAEKTDVLIKVLHSAKSLRENTLGDYQPSEFNQPFSFKPKILYLEDDIRFQESIISGLSNHFDFVVASTLSEAQQLFNDSIHAAIVDINLDEKTDNDVGGLYFIKWLKQKSDIPFIVVTGYRSENILNRIKLENPDYIFNRTLDIFSLKQQLFKSIYESMI